MSKNSRERLYDAITNISDTYIEEAQDARFAKKSFNWRIISGFVAAAAVFVLVIAGAFNAPNSDLLEDFDMTGESVAEDSVTENAFLDEEVSDDVAEEGNYSFMSYSGPVFPMTLAEENENITAARDVTFDFSENAFGNTVVTDSYTLTNTSDSDETVTVLYPFVSSLRDFSGNIPTMISDGEVMDVEINVGDYAQSYSWEEYMQLMSDGSYQEKALSGSAGLSDIPVVVYEFSNAWGTERSEDVVNPTIHAIFDLDWEETIVFSYGFDGMSGYDDYMDTTFSIPQASDPNYGEPVYLIVVGDDIENLRTEGYVTGGWDTNDTIKYGIDIKRTETNLADALRTVLPYLYDDFEYGDAVNFEMYYEVFSNYLTTFGALAEGSEERYESGFLADVRAPVVDCVVYLESEITIPAGESVTISAEMIKTPNFDYGGSGTGNEGVYGYDLATNVGSNVEFTGQTATIIDNGNIEIVGQNFGFDLANDVKTVTLDQSEEHYYLEVR